MPQKEISPEQKGTFVSHMLANGGEKITDVAKPTTVSQREGTGAYRFNDSVVVIYNWPTEVELQGGVKREGIPQNVLVTDPETMYKLMNAGANPGDQV